MKDLRDEVFEANLRLVDEHLVILAWGNASGIDRDQGVFLIKPSGVSYAELEPGRLVAVDLDGKVAEGTLNPSSDTATHLELYKAWPEIGGIVHTHSTYAASFAQACRPIPCYGTTHCDFCPGDIPCVRALTKEEVEEAYEKNTGTAIIEDYKNNNRSPVEYPGVILSRHGPFTWGKNAHKAVENAVILERLAQMALLTRRINPEIGPIPEHILNKHHMRKHGPNAYYGQKCANSI
ncbi:MAG: L-ribulose-5-phosphate 4-epimerase AraD [Planctomycetota bacterium]|nr:L-ribulose-5-phosphate 4-epimerase AraD [Planctomycetota bacterium]